MANKQNEVPNVYRFLFGGLSGMAATCVVQPIDLVKTRMQLSGEGGTGKVHKSSFHAFTAVARQEGIRKLYSGLSAGLLRQATYTTTRLGVFDVVSGWMTTPGENTSFLKKILAGMIAGGLGSLVGTPAEVALIRMTSDGGLPVEQRRNYTNVGNALLRITREEGILTLWRGATPTVARAVVLNAAQLGTYGQAKEVLISSGHFKDGIGTHFCASLISGFISTVVSIPIDMAKTRLQKMKVVNGVGEYKGFIDVMTQVARKEGPLALWKGFTPYFLRLGPHTILTFIALEQMKKSYITMKNK